MTGSASRPDVQIRPIEPEEFGAWFDVMATSFGHRLRDEVVQLERSFAEPPRTLAAVEGDRMVGGNAAIGVELAVPGGRCVPTAAIIGVGVLPSHTRRGISTALMRRQLDAVHERGEPLAVLHASEGAIYGRYGFGLATRSGSLQADRSGVAFVRGYEPVGSVELVERDAAIAALVRAAELTAGRPGHLGPAARLADYTVRDAALAPEDEGGAGPFYAVHRDPGGHPDGAVVYRVRQAWPENLPRFTASVEILLGATPAAEAALWRYVFDLDLVGTVEAWHRPAADPLLWLVREPRALRMRVGDDLYLRLVDVRSALAARAYAGEGSVVLGVQDPFCPWNAGAWRLVAAGGRAEVEPTDAEPELELSSTDLATIYLGDASFADLADALLVRVRDPAALERADRLFATPQAPRCWVHV